MRVVGIKTLKNRLSEYLRAVAAGETVLVTDRDRVVAEIVRPGARRPESAGEALLADAVRRGLITPASLADRGPPPARPAAPAADLLKELDEDRSGR